MTKLRLALGSNVFNQFKVNQVGLGLAYKLKLDYFTNHDIHLPILSYSDVWYIKEKLQLTTILETFSDFFRSGILSLLDTNIQTSTNCTKRQLKTGQSEGFLKIFSHFTFYVQGLFEYL